MSCRPHCSASSLPTRVLPVTIDSMTIAEQEYDFALNPVRAEVDITLSVIAIDQCSDDVLAKGALEYSTIAKEAMAIANLANTAEQIVELIPQRGVFVAKPTIEQARDVFEARRLIEPAVLRRLVDTLTPEKLARLRQHQDLELDARQRDDKRAVIRLSGEFHSLAAELAGNGALARSMRELYVLTCLMIFLYDAPTATSCRADEHSQIIEAIAKRDATRAEQLMLEHLEHIESSMKLEQDAEEVDLEAIFRN